MELLEIFNSISGEVCPYHQGCLTTFVRFPKCNLKCNYCFGSPDGRRQPYLTSSQTSPIKLKEAKVGDVILTYDEDFNIVETTIHEVHTREVDSWLRITIDNVQYFVTHEHPFMTPKGIIRADELTIGDDIYYVKGNDIISFKQKGERNPMKNKDVSRKSAQNTNYEEIGRKVSKAIKQKQLLGTYRHPKMSIEARIKHSQRMKGDANPNWNGGSKTPNYDRLRNKGGACSSCNSSRFLEVHHIDTNRDNDAIENLIILCKSCHTKVHKKGYNFWNGLRRDKKQLATAIGNNGKTIQAIKEFIRGDYPTSLRPKPLTVYNLTCSPHNTYFLDNMWVHNCDTRVNGETIDVSIQEIQQFYQRTGHLCITGGEPLIHRKEVEELVTAFPNSWIETNGTYDFSDFIGRTGIVADHKLSLVDYNIPNYFFKLTAMDFVKFVVPYECEIVKAVNIQRTLEMCGTTCKFAYSPLANLLPVYKLTESLIDKQVNALVNIQIHKYVDMK